MKVACVQLRSGKEVAANIRLMEQGVREAAAAGAALVATPEMTSMLDRTPGAVLTKSVDQEADPALAAAKALAADLRIALLLGSIPIRTSPSQVANRSFLISPTGAVVAWYDKIHMFDVQLGAGEIYRESDTFSAGSRLVVGDVPGARIGLSVCYDVRFPHLYRDLARAGAQILTIPAAFTRMTGEAHWHVLLRARAIETACFVLAPAQGGLHEDGRQTYGHSLIVDPWGRILAEAQSNQPQIILADLDLQAVRDARQKIPALSHDRPYSAG